MLPIPDTPRRAGLAGWQRVPCLAQSSSEVREGRSFAQPPDKLPKVRADRRILDFLFGALKAAPDDASAKQVEESHLGAVDRLRRATPRIC